MMDYTSVLIFHGMVLPHARSPRDWLFETNLRRERQLEGIAKAKLAGVYKGRPASIDADEVRQLKSSGKGATEIARAMGVGRAPVYRLLAAA